MKNLIETVLKNPVETVFTVFGSALLILVLVAIAVDHPVRCNYLDSTFTEVGISYRVMNDINWMEDSEAITTPDLSVALEVLSNMKQCTGE